MIENISRVRIKVGERVYELACDQNCTFPELREGLCQMIKYIGQIEDSSNSLNKADDEKIIVEEVNCV